MCLIYFRNVNQIIVYFVKRAIKPIVLHFSRVCIFYIDFYAIDIKDANTRKITIFDNDWVNFSFYEMRTIDSFIFVIIKSRLTIIIHGYILECKLSISW